MIGLLCLFLGLMTAGHGSRTMIAGSLSSCIAGFHQSCGFSRSSVPRPSCVGIGPASCGFGMLVAVSDLNDDRWLFIQLYRWFPSILRVLTIIRPETIVRWHRAGKLRVRHVSGGG